MNRKNILVALSLLVLASLAAAQSPRTRPSRQTATPKATPTPAPTPQSSPTPAADPASPTIAVVNDVTISASDIEDQVRAIIQNDPDPYLLAFYTSRDQAVKEARERALNARVNSLMIGSEAKKRGLNVEDYLQREIDARIPAPTEAEIQATYNANRSQLGNADLESVRAQLVNYLRGQRREELYGALTNRLKMTNTVMKNADVNAPNLATGTVLTSVNGAPIRVDAINERMKAYVYKMETRIYEARKQVLNRRINDLLIVADANRRKITPEEIVRTEITDKIKQPTEPEIAKFYEENKARITGDLASARADISTYLQQQQQESLERALADKLRVGVKLQIMLPEPAAPVLNVSTADGASRGDVNAAVTVVEFTDFQCSACGAMYPIIEDLLKSYGNRLHFVIRNFPLVSIHENAFRAAQGAAAAKAQGKFWEYIDLLFRNQSALDVESLKKYATQVGLDRKRFDADLESGKYDADIRRDIEDGEMYGVEATPTIYINGVVLTEFSADGLRAAIDRAFAKAQKGSR